MVRLFQKVGRIIRGESEAEYDQRKTANIRIRAAEREAVFKARQEEAIKYAIAKERIIREAKEKRLRASLNPPKRTMPSLRDTPFTGQSTFSVISGYSMPQPRTRRIKRRKAKGRVRTVTRYIKSPAQPPRRFDILGI